MVTLAGYKNLFVTPDTLARFVLANLLNNLVAVRMCYNPTLQSNFKMNVNGYKVGQGISVRKARRHKIVSGRVASPDPMIDEYTTVDVNHHYNGSFNFTPVDSTLRLGDVEEDVQDITEKLANQMDYSILVECATHFFNTSGTPGTAINLNALLDADALMSERGVPTSNRFALHSYLDGANIRKDIKGTASLMKDAPDAIRNSQLFRLGNMDHYQTQNLVKNVTGAKGGTPLINGAGQTGASYATDGWPNSTLVIKAGNVFTVAGVNSVNPQTYQNTGILYYHVATADVTSNGSGVATIPFAPYLNDGSLTTTDSEGNTLSKAAYQNASNVPADNAAITVLGTANATYRRSVLMQKAAIAFVPVPLAVPKSAVVKKMVRHKKSGISVLITSGYDVTNFLETTRVDVLWGVKAIYPELGHLLYSEAVV